MDAMGAIGGVGRKKPETRDRLEVDPRRRPNATRRAAAQGGRGVPLIQLQESKHRVTGDARKTPDARRPVTAERAQLHATNLEQ